MKTILKSLAKVDNQKKFLVGTKLFKRVNKKGKNIFLEYKLVWANWDGEYRMLIRKIDKKSYKSEYGIIPEKLESGKIVVNTFSLQRTLGNRLTDWFIIEKE